VDSKKPSEKPSPRKERKEIEEENLPTGRET